MKTVFQFQAGPNFRLDRSIPRKSNLHISLIKPEDYRNIDCFRCDSPARSFLLAVFLKRIGNNKAGPQNQFEEFFYD